MVIHVPGSEHCSHVIAGGLNASWVGGEMQRYVILRQHTAHIVVNVYSTRGYIVLKCRVTRRSVTSTAKHAPIIRERERGSPARQ